MVSNERRIGREVACELLFPNLGPAAVANASVKGPVIGTKGFFVPGRGGPRSIEGGPRSHLG